MFGTMVTQCLERTGELQRFFQASPLGEVEQTLGQAENSCRVLRNLSGNLHCTLQQLFRWRHLADQPNAQRLSSVNHTTGESQFQGFGKTDDPREQESATIPRDQSYRNKSFAKKRFPAGNTDVTHAGEIAARAHGRAIHRSNGWYVEALERECNSLDSLAVVLAHVIRIPREHSLLLIHVLDIPASRKG